MAQLSWVREQAQGWRVKHGRRWYHAGLATWSASILGVLWWFAANPHEEIVGLILLVLGVIAGLSVMMQGPTSLLDFDRRVLVLPDGTKVRFESIRRLDVLRSTQWEPIFSPGVVGAAESVWFEVFAVLGDGGRAVPLITTWRGEHLMSRLRQFTERTGIPVQEVGVPKRRRADRRTALR